MQPDEQPVHAKKFDPSGLGPECGLHATCDRKLVSKLRSGFWASQRMLAANIGRFVKIGIFGMVGIGSTQKSETNSLVPALCLCLCLCLALSPSLSLCVRI
jgi:hypothetical protein